MFLFFWRFRAQHFVVSTNAVFNNDPAENVWNVKGTHSVYTHKEMNFFQSSNGYVLDSCSLQKYFTKEFHSVVLEKPARNRPDKVELQNENWLSISPQIRVEGLQQNMQYTPYSAARCRYPMTKTFLHTIRVGGRFASWGGTTGSTNEGSSSSKGTGSAPKFLGGMTFTSAVISSLAENKNIRT